MARVEHEHSNEQATANRANADDETGETESSMDTSRVGLGNPSGMAPETVDTTSDPPSGGGGGESDPPSGGGGG